MMGVQNVRAVVRPAAGEAVAVVGAAPTIYRPRYFRLTDVTLDDRYQGHLWKPEVENQAGFDWQIMRPRTLQRTWNEWDGTEGSVYQGGRYVYDSANERRVYAHEVDPPPGTDPETQVIRPRLHNGEIIAGFPADLYEDGLWRVRNDLEVSGEPDHGSNHSEFVLIASSGGGDALPAKDVYAVFEVLFGGQVRLGQIYQWSGTNPVFRCMEGLDFTTDDVVTVRWAFRWQAETDARAWMRKYGT